ncbi:DMT family transporter [Microvirga pudoricolor]|uniref:DMT family transporter n=1 Tax=Microvirga pudoricolor TaxID=2778729 RepID=UPI00194E1C57|nr:DMT family transporter [Microvirga pudoricolor]MBM6594753.1 DMT family transporter [Microvirga pudoricolor]
MTKQAIRTTMAASDWALLGLLSVVWGGSFLFVGVAVGELPPLTIVAARVALAAVALLIVLRVMGSSLPRGPRIWGAFLIMGLLNNMIPFTLIVWAQGHIPSGLASILNATTPLFTVIVAHCLTPDEPMTARRLAGVLVGFSGVVVMLGGAALKAFDTGILAQCAVMGAALSYAFASVFGRRFKAWGVAPVTIAAGQVTMSSLVLVPASLSLDRPWSLPAPGLSVIVSIVALALVSTAFAYILFFRLLARTGATNTGLVTFLIPVSAILFGTLLLGEALEPRQIAGMALIAAGLVVLDGRVFGGWKPSGRAAARPGSR